jgi:hypothetical protein
LVIRASGNGLPGGQVGYRHGFATNRTHHEPENPVRLSGEEQRKLQRAVREYGISTKTRYKWKARFETDGPEGLKERSRRPRSSPEALSEEIVCRLGEPQEFCLQDIETKLSRLSSLLRCKIVKVCWVPFVS